MNLKDYASMARPSHWFKAIFMLPGTVFGVIELRQDLGEIIIPFVFGLATSCLIASANYVLNEILDADSDRHHPTKKYRPAVMQRVSTTNAYLFYLILLASGFLISFLYVNIFFMAFDLD